MDRRDPMIERIEAMGFDVLRVGHVWRVVGRGEDFKTVSLAIALHHVQDVARREPWSMQDSIRPRRIDHR